MLVISRLWIITITNLVWQMHISVFKFVSVAKSMHWWIVPTLLNPNSLKKNKKNNNNRWLASEAYPLWAHINWHYLWGNRSWHTILESTCPGGGQTWHNFNLTYCLSTCSVINTIYTIYCAIINVKIQKYIFWFSLQKYFTNKFCLPQGQVTFRI